MAGRIVKAALGNVMAGLNHLCRPEVSSTSDRRAQFREVYGVVMLERKEDNENGVENR